MTSGKSRKHRSVFDVKRQKWKDKEARIIGCPNEPLNLMLLLLEKLSY